MLTEQELHNKLTTDPHFAASFIVQNNFQGVKEKMADLGIMVSEPIEAYKILVTWSESKMKGAKDQIAYVTNIPYLPGAENATGGYGDFFLNNTTQEQRKKLAGQNGNKSGKIDWATAGMAFASSGLVGLVPYLLTSGGGGTGKTPEQIEAEKKAEEEAAAEEARKKRLIWTIGGIVGAFVFIGGIIFLTSRPTLQTNTSTQNA